MWRIFGMVFIVAFSFGYVACGDDDAGSLTEAVYAYGDAYASWECGCHWEEEGFSSEEECLEERTSDSDDISDAVQCSRDAEDEVEGERPAGMDEYFACAIEAFDEVINCMDGVDECGVEGAAQLDACVDDLDDAEEECMAALMDDEDAYEWMSEWIDNREEICPDS